MKVTIYLFANKHIYQAIMVADNKNQSLKKISQEHKAESIMENYLLAALAAFKSLKFPVDIHLVSARNTFSFMPDYEDEIPDQDYIKANIKKWKELSCLIKKHKSYKANKHKDNEDDRKKWNYYRKSMITSNENSNLDKMDTLF